MLAEDSQRAPGLARSSASGALGGVLADTDRFEAGTHAVDSQGPAVELQRHSPLGRQRTGCAPWTQKLLDSLLRLIEKSALSTTFSTELKRSENKSCHHFCLEFSCRNNFTSIIPIRGSLAKIPGFNQKLHRAEPSSLIQQSCTCLHMLFYTYSPRNLLGDSSKEESPFGDSSKMLLQPVDSL